jgi:hypothetical protein
MLSRKLTVCFVPEPRSRVWLAVCLSGITSVITSCTQPNPERKSSNFSLQQPLQPAATEIQQAFAEGIVELFKEGAPLARGGFQITIEPYGAGWRMKYSQIPPKMSGDRLLFIQGRYVEVVPLF